MILKKEREKKVEHELNSDGLRSFKPFIVSEVELKIRNREIIYGKQSFVEEPAKGFLHILEYLDFSYLNAAVNLKKILR